MLLRSLPLHRGSTRVAHAVLNVTRSCVFASAEHPSASLQGRSAEKPIVMEERRHQNELIALVKCNNVSAPYSLFKASARTSHRCS